MKFGYVRQYNKYQDIKKQTEALKRAGVKAQNIFKDISSEINDEKKEFNTLIKGLIEEDVLYVYSLETIASTVNDLLKLFGYLKKEGIGLISIREPIINTTKNPNRDFIYSFCKLMLQINRNFNAVDSTQTNKKELYVEEGVVLGVLDKKKRLSSIERRKKVLITEVLYTKSDYTISEIADLLNFKKTQTVIDYLKLRNVSTGIRKGGRRSFLKVIKS